MTLKPASVEELAELLANASARGEKISSVSLAALNRLLEHTAEDMTATVEAGVTLAELQRLLAAHGQWLPIDPPKPEQLAVGTLLAADASGPRRFGYGTIRDYVIGLKAVLADGQVIHSGGKVVKNVAGYDLMKLFIGSRGSLGVIVEATFKLRPLPGAETFFQANCPSLDEADKFIEAVLDSEFTPVVVDLHNLSAAAGHSSLVLGLAGTREEVEWQSAKAAELGFAGPSSLDYQETLGAEESSFRKVSVLPSKTVEVIRALNGARFIARAGNGIIYHCGAFATDSHERPTKLEQRLKNEFDPKHILPDLP